MYIGNNVFIGMQTTILKGVHIGNNVIIGANSLVNTDIPDNCVAAGNPCREIMTIDDYYKKRKSLQIKEATEMVHQYRERYGTEPSAEIMRELFWLFSNDPDGLPEEWRKVNRLLGNEEYTNNIMKRHRTAFHSMNDFLKSVK